ncbi:MAG: ATP-binding protein [Acidimicrobiia bacterium]
MSESRRTPLAFRFLTYYAVAYVVLIVLMGIAIDRATQRALLEDLTNNLVREAQLISTGIPDDPVLLPNWADEMFAVGGFRVTVVDIDGVVLADSHSDPAVMENHSDRPEIVEAAATGDPGVATRTSASTGAEQLYVALPPNEGVSLRVSMPTRAIGAELITVRSSIVVVAAIIGLVGIGVVALLARRMAKPITELTKQSQALAEGDLNVAPLRSDLRELDELGMAISTLASDLRHRVSEAEEANASLLITLAALPQGTVLVDSEDHVVYANPSAKALIGSIPQELGSLSPYALQTLVRDARGTGETIARTIETGTPRRSIRAAVTPFVENREALIVMVDVTDQERVASIRRDFVANASHELKTPVSSIIAASEALRIAVERQDGSASRFAEQIEGSARQLDALVSDLLDLSRLERESPVLNPVRLDLLVGDEIEGVRPDADKKALVLTSNLELTIATASHQEVATAVRNLLDNAIRYTPVGGEIEVSVKQSDGHAVVSVRDTGEGIPNRDLDRVFERFYRVDAARSRATGGTGLGLSIVKHVAQGHGGSVRVESELGVGSTFTLALPIPDEGEAPTSN